MSDAQDRSEALDEDKLEDADYPPDRPLGADQYGVTAQEDRIDEPIAERFDREEPDELVVPSRGVQLVDNTADSLAGQYDPAAAELDADETGEEVIGILAEGDESPFNADPDRTPQSAEEAAVHIVDEP